MLKRLLLFSYKITKKRLYFHKKPLFLIFILVIWYQNHLFIFKPFILSIFSTLVECKVDIFCARPLMTYTKPISSIK